MKTIDRILVIVTFIFFGYWLAIFIKTLFILVNKSLSPEIEIFGPTTFIAAMLGSWTYSIFRYRNMADADPNKEKKNRITFVIGIICAIVMTVVFIIAMVGRYF
jgi:hypothetical protein